MTAPLALLLLASSALAQEGGGVAPAARPVSAGCADVDVRSHIPPVRDQGRVSWCFAYAAADLLAAKMRKPISALDLALQYHDGDAAYSKRNKMEEGGSLTGAIAVAAAKGVCLDQDVPSDMKYDYHLGHEIQEVDARSYLERLEERVVAYVRSRGPRGTGILMADATFEAWNLLQGDDSNPCSAEFSTDRLGPEARERRLANAVCVQTYHKALMRFPGLTRKQYYEALLLTVDRRILARLSSVACRSRLKPEPAPEAVHHRLWEDRGKATVIVPGKAIAAWRGADAALDAGKPVGLSYDWSLMETKPSEYVFALGAGNHASTLVGRRRDPSGRCEYLLRNSWGVGCAKEALYPCRQGQYWVPQDALAAGTYGLTWLR